MEEKRTPWYRKTRYIVMIGILVVLLVFGLISNTVVPTKSSDQSRLDRTINYFAQNYNATTGLLPQATGSGVYWLYPDNYLVTLAIGRYNSGNATTSDFAQALYAAFDSYLSTLPKQYDASEYTALNSTAASFGCVNQYSLAWTPQSEIAPATARANIMTEVNTGSQSCSSGNFADILLLQALWYHRFGNSTAATHLYDLASADFNGDGFADAAYNGTSYQTSKLALFVYTSSCLAINGTNYNSATKILFSMQDNSTGGFYQAYAPNTTALNAPPLTPVGGVSTDATALASLALEQLIHPSSGC